MSAPILTTTLNLLREHGACVEGYAKLRKALPKRYPMDKPIDLAFILKSNGLMDALWCFRALTDGEANALYARLIAADFAEHVQDLYRPSKTQNTWRPTQTITVARRFSLGLANSAARGAARDAAWDATWGAAVAAAGGAAVAAAWAASVAAAVAAAGAAGAAAVASGAARAEEERWQAQRLAEWLTGQRTPEHVRAELTQDVGA